VADKQKEMEAQIALANQAIADMERRQSILNALRDKLIKMFGMMRMASAGMLMLSVSNLLTFFPVFSNNGNYLWVRLVLLFGGGVLFLVAAFQFYRFQEEERRAGCSEPTTTQS